jgi:hypothetical protein
MPILDGMRSGAIAQLAFRHLGLRGVQMVAEF